MKKYTYEFYVSNEDGTLPLSGIYDDNCVEEIFDVFHAVSALGFELIVHFSEYED